MNDRRARGAITAWQGACSPRRVRRDALACVALPTCGLAMAEAERYLPDFVERVEERWRSTACGTIPLTAAHHRLPEWLRAAVSCRDRADRAAPGRYTLRLGGDAIGQRLNVIYRDNIDENAILVVLDRAVRALCGRAAGRKNASAISCGAPMLRHAGDPRMSESAAVALAECAAP